MTVAETSSSPSAAPAVPGFRERFVGMLVRPRETFARLHEPDAWFWPAILFLVGYGVYYQAMALGTARLQFSMTGKMLQNTASGTAAAGDPVTQSILSAMPFIYLFLIAMSPLMVAAMSWALRTGIFYGLARLLGGGPAPWSRVMAMVGWAWVPLFFQYLLLGTAMLVSWQVFSYLQAAPADQSIGGAAQAMRGKWHVQVIVSASPFVLWNLWLCVLGVTEVFTLPRWKATLVVLVPYVVQLALVFTMYLGSLAMLDAMTGIPVSSPSVPNAPAP